MSEDWEGHKLYIMETLKRIEHKLDEHISTQEQRVCKLEEKQAATVKDVAVIRAQAILIGSFSAILVSVIFQLIISSLR